MSQEQICTDQDQGQGTNEQTNDPAYGTPRKTFKIEPQSPSTPTSPVISHSLRALLYKSVRLQLKKPLSIIFQILTPLLCIAFTLVVKAIAEGFTVGKVPMIPFPMPLHLPLASAIFARTVIPISCSERYYYEADAGVQAEVLLRKVLTLYCGEQGKLSPIFQRKDSVDAALLNVFSIANQAVMQRNQQIDTILPDGLIKFHGISSSTLNMSVGINDWRLPTYHKNNGVTLINSFKPGEYGFSYLRVTEGLLSLLQKLNRAYLSSLQNKEIIMGSYMYMPFDGEDRSLINKVVNVMGLGLYPIALSLLLPMLLYTLVMEKEGKLLHSMRMHGLNLTHYWLHFFLHTLLLSSATFSLLFLLGRYIFALTFFNDTSANIFLHLSLSWTVSMASLTVLAQSFLINSKTATIIGYILSIFSTLLGSVLSSVVFPDPFVLPTALQLYPPFALCRSFYLLGISCATIGGCMQQIQGEILSCILIMYSWGVVFAVCALCTQRITNQYGDADPSCLLMALHKAISDSFSWTDKFIKRQNGLQHVTQSDEEEAQEPTFINFDSPQKMPVDSSILEQRHYTESLTTTLKPLCILGLSKTYPNSHRALKQTTFCLQENQIFGLLGPNGAGKTTMISVLTGMQPQSGGQAYIHGQPIATHSASQMIGVCPQFDLLWTDLTVEEHITFYAKLKGVKQDCVEQCLSNVDLIPQRHTEAKHLSGGMQRRLSLAIALVGNPKVVFLDQPSSGLDPSHRRQLWDILLKCKSKTSIFLTTHLMQEAEVLCDRVGIINQGKMYCIGTQLELKEKFGEGYRVAITYTGYLRVNGFGPNRPKIVDQLIEQCGCTIANELQNRVVLRVGRQQLVECIRILRKDKKVSWGVSQPSLSDVFAKFVS